MFDNHAMPNGSAAPITEQDLADQTRLGRLLTQLENDPRGAAALMSRLPATAQSRSAQRIGFTGSPGVGKSTLLGRLVQHWRMQGKRCGVLAVDPSSPFSGGAILADRLRWVELAGPDVFVRSLASRGSLGGVSAGAGAVAKLIEAAGYSPLLIETIGVGQSGFDVLALADTVVVLFSPESGDSLQMLKAGMLEAGDIIVVNKADRPGADVMLKEIGYALELQREAAISGTDESVAWDIPVQKLCASTGEGLIELADSIQRHSDWLNALPPEHPRRLRRIRSELIYSLRARFGLLLETALAEQLDAAVAAVHSQRLTFWDALEQLSTRAAQSL